MRLGKRKAIFVALSLTVSGALLGSSAAQACSCISAASTGAGKISGLVGTGSTAITQAMFAGFQSVGSTVDGSIGLQTSNLTNALEAFTKNVVSEIQKLPAYEQQHEANLDRLHPARHATNACSYTDRANDSIAAERLTALQEVNLNETSAQYNAMTSSYPEGVNPDDRFLLQTYSLVNNQPDILTSGMDLVSSTDSFGAFTPEQLQAAATYINLTTNPSPPARMSKPSTPSALKENVRADLYNLRMSVPQAVQNQILAYNAPVLSQSDDSWLAEQLSRMTPDAAQAFQDGDLMVSKADLIKLMATHRVRDAAWVSNLDAKDVKGAIKDLALTKADAFAMDYELWLQDKNMALLMSQLLAAQNRQQRGGM